MQRRLPALRPVLALGLARGQPCLGPRGSALQGIQQTFPVTLLIQSPCFIYRGLPKERIREQGRKCEHRTKLSFASNSGGPLTPRNLGPCPFLAVCKLQIAQPSLSAFHTVPWHSPLPSPEQPACSALLVPLPGQPLHSEPTLRPVQLQETSPELPIQGTPIFSESPKHLLSKE